MPHMFNCLIASLRASGSKRSNNGHEGLAVPSPPGLTASGPAPLFPTSRHDCGTVPPSKRHLRRSSSAVVSIWLVTQMGRNTCFAAIADSPPVCSPRSERSPLLGCQPRPLRPGIRLHLLGQLPVTRTNCSGRSAAVTTLCFTFMAFLTLMKEAAWVGAGNLNTSTAAAQAATAFAIWTLSGPFASRPASSSSHCRTSVAGPSTKARADLKRRHDNSHVSTDSLFFRHCAERAVQLLRCLLRCEDPDWHHGGNEES